MLKKLLPGFATLRVLHKASVTHRLSLDDAALVCDHLGTPTLAAYAAYRRAACDPQVTAESRQAAVAAFLSDIEPHLGFSPYALQYALREVGFFAAAATLVVGLLVVRAWL